VIQRLRHLKQPATLFGESEAERYQRLLAAQDKISLDMKKKDFDETARTFVPDDEEVELLKFKKMQEMLLKEEENKRVGAGHLEELKEDDDDDEGV
jgi:hypothetical protein